MFKVLIIDDEPTIRKGLINIINWKKFQCEICGEASDGVEGLEKIEAYKPDLVFADINMPEINGLEMIKSAKQIVPHSKFIILSGYREFSYMQEAIKIGAFDYILKPSSIEDICEVVKRAVIELKYQRDDQLEAKKLRKCFEESIPILKEKLLYDIIFQININEEEIKEGFELYGIEINEFVMIMIEIDGDSKKKEPYQRQLYQFGIVNTVEEMFAEEFKVEKIVLNNKQIAFIIGTHETVELLEEDVYKKVHSIQQLVESCFDFTVSIAISTKGKDVDELHDKMMECKNALAYRFYMGNSSIILYRDLSGFYKGQDNLAFDGIDKVLCNTIKTGNEEDVVHILGQINDKVIQTNLDPEYIKTFYWNLIYEINMIRISIKNLEVQDKDLSHDISSLYKLIDNATQVKELQDLLEDVAMSVVHRINRYNKKNINQILQKAMDYICENYTMSITLNELAEHTYVSTYYLSRMFKKELGKNFVEYLNEVRIDKAKELLKDNKYKTYEVAELVGIQDPHYFSKIFKKYVNMTPTEYKDSQL
ncbi:response regulator [Cellulosilyticum lentocellum]|uniref:Stage 0 sporulation protein A homolog n=1 Tax=Cellulosilyticum lentocellum (strain ATCC 49066 / DSM 5427 / NCIMB 11756 / RHM5) TaxID=642492 RepID=F2JQA2_CELLD|nr:response regulator [Cellulosilyticum lentocellum]ADZ83764.1 two component transcriptional regulator, AraC family [Cellulosilyticum lentocellum DSM 5427]